VTIFYLLIHPAAGVLIDFKGVTWGLVEKKAKKQTRRNSIKNRKENKKGIRKIKRNTIYNL
jgi:hypothetical protein